MKIDNDAIHQITLLLQITLCLFVLNFAIATTFCKELFIICEILTGLLMFVIAYNNQKIYKRKYMTAIYTGLGIVVIVASLLG